MAIAKLPGNGYERIMKLDANSCGALSTRVILVPLLLIASFPVLAEEKTTSVFTSMDSDCHDAFDASEAGEGSDIPQICKGPKKYSIYEYYSGDESFRSIQRGKEDLTGTLGALSPCERGTYGQKMEWRLRDGEPFALIYRITCYRAEGDKTPNNRTGEYLMIQPLAKGQPAIEIDLLRTKKANRVARTQADSLVR
jgi:hypothetical protein